MVAPLKLNGTAGDLKEITTTEENYLAYLAGLQLAAMSDTDVSALTNTNAGGNVTTVGTYTNTFFNEAVGTHDGTNITSGSEITTLYQKTGTASEASVDFHRPILWAGSGNVEEADNTELNEVVDRLLSTIFTNDYPGVYKLAATSPGADWDVHLGQIFTDTQSLGGPQVDYSIYQRQTMTPPTEVKTVKILNDTTAFDGLKEMNTTEMQVTYGQRAKTRIMNSANSIGAYQLRSSAQGAPVAAGTWRAVGTATDTKDTTTNVAYAGSYANTFVGSYSRSFTGSYSRSFTGFYTGSFTGSYSNSFTGFYTGSFAGGYTRNVQQFFTTFYNSMSFNNNLNRSASFSRFVPITYTGFYSRSFTGSYSNSFSGTYTRAFTGSYTSSFTGFYTGSFTGSYGNSFTGFYTGLTIDSTDTTIETYTLYVRAA